MISMAKKPPKKTNFESYRKPRRTVSVPERIAVQFEPLMAQNETNLTDEVKAACIFYLTHKGHWPPATKEGEEAEEE